jgi:hypothetical protein
LIDRPSWNAIDEWNADVLAAEFPRETQEKGLCFNDESEYLPARQTFAP